jgi:hypothetical protein
MNLLGLAATLAGHARLRRRADSVIAQAAWIARHRRHFKAAMGMAREAGVGIRAATSGANAIRHRSESP